MSEARHTRLPEVDDALDRVLASIVAGVPEDGAVRELASMEAQQVCSRAEYHGLGPLLAERLAGHPDTPSALRAPLHHAALTAAAVDVVAEAELRAALAEFDRSSVEVLLLKGAHLAYDCYERPELRPRADTDLLIAPAQRDTVHEILTGLGYEPPRHAEGTLLTYQAAYVKRRDGATAHVFDIHWRVANPHVFGRVLTFEELSASAACVPRLGGRARAPSLAHALLLACVHRVAHHFDSDRLIWLYDIHLLASRATSGDWQRVLDLADERHVATVCRSSLVRAAAFFRTHLPALVMSDPRLCVREEPSAAYLTARPHVQNVLDDLHALPRWRDRLRLLRQHLLPPSRYMRDVYAASSRAPLPLLYARRAIRGARRWFLRPALPDPRRIV